MATMKSLGWVASTGINYLDDGRDVRLEVGQAVPASLVADNPWLVEQGWVTSVATASGREQFPDPDADPDPATNADLVPATPQTEADDGAVSRF